MQKPQYLAFGNSHRFFKLCLAVLLLCTGLFNAKLTFANNPLLWPNDGSDAFREKLLFFVDPNRQYHGDNVPDAALFKADKGFRHPYTQNDIWASISLHEFQGNTHELYFANNDPMFDVIDIYARQQDGSFSLVRQLGDRNKSGKEPGIYRFDLANYETRDFLFKFNHNGTFNIPIKLYSDMELFIFINKNTAIMSAFYSTLIALIVVYFIVVRTHINRSDIYFICSSIFAGFCFAHIDGLFHLISDHNWIKIGNLEIFTYLYVVCWALFVKHYPNNEGETSSRYNLILCNAFIFFSVTISAGTIASLFTESFSMLNRIYLLPVIAFLTLTTIILNLCTTTYRNATIVSSGIPCVLMCVYLTYNDVSGTTDSFEDHITARTLWIANLLFAVYILSKQSINRVQKLLHNEQRKRFDDIKVLETDQLIANITASLRTPLSGLTGMIDLIRSTPLESTQRHCIDIIDRSGSDMVRLIDNFEDYNSNNSSFTSEISEVFNLEDCIINSCHSVAQQATNRNLEILYDPKYDTSHKFIGDPMKIRKVISRLLSNAVHYSSNSEINIVSTLSQVEFNNTINVVVWIENRISTDTQENISNIKQFFQSGNNSNTVNGLDIAKQLLHSMGGELKHQIQKNTVSLGFSISLEPAPKTLRNNDRALQDQHCLIIAPKSKRVELLENQLEQWQMKASHISNIDMIDREYLKRHDFDCCIIDTDCHFTNRFINNHFLREFHTELPPAIFISYSLRQPEASMDNCQWQTRCLAKPMHRDKLKTAIKKLVLLNDGKSNDYISISNTAPPSMGFNMSLDIDSQSPYEKHRVLVAEDNLVNRQVLRSLLDRLEVTCEFRNNGYEATTALCETNRNYTLVLMDCDMPGIDGFEATKKIRQYEKRHNLSPVPIIAVTSMGAKEQEDKAKASGMTGFIRKPVSLDTLRLELDKLDRNFDEDVVKIY